MEYKPLIDDIEEIRVVTILPASADGLIHCTIEAVSLINWTEGNEPRSIHPEPATWIDDTSATNAIKTPDQSQYRFKWGDYACLSYTWGDENKTTTIIANDTEIQVTTNLEACLQAMQRRSMFNAGLKIWIDAICINQLDIVERGRQVAKMRDIYSLARSVIIWLGVESEDSHKAIKLLEKLSYYFISGDHDERDTPKLRMEIETLKSSLKADPEYLGRGSWIALREFLGRPYWDRLWIMQEILISSSKTVLCGSQSVDWDTLCRGLGTIHSVLFVMKNDLLKHDQEVCGDHYARPWSTKNLHRVMKDLYLLGADLRKNRVAIYLPGIRVDNNPRFCYMSKPLDIHRLLQIANQALCFDVRDKVYGLLAIIEPQFARQIIPSYNMDAGAVFNMVARTHIQTYKSLEILREANSWGSNNSASWAPDWTWLGRHRFAIHLVPYKASGATTTVARFSDEGHILECTGVIIDKVDSLGPRHKYSTFTHGAPAWEFDMDTMVQPQATSLHDIEITQLRSYLCRALTRDRSWEVPNSETTWQFAVFNLLADVDSAMKTFSERGPGWEFLAAERDYYNRWTSWRKAHADFKIFGHRLDDFFTDCVPSDALHDDYSAAYSAVRGSSQAQRLVVTEKGRLGWVPDNISANASGDQVQSGDMFCILYGCSTPIVMRPHRDGFVVLGEGYLQGMMEGEALQMVGDGEHFIQDFKIY